MITSNIDKKSLVEKLLQDKIITIDQAFMLLDEVQPQVITIPYTQPYIVPAGTGYPLYPGSPTLPWYEIGKTYCGDQSTPVCTMSVGNATCNYTTIDMATEFAKGTISYTGNTNNSRIAAFN